MKWPGVSSLMMYLFVGLLLLSSLYFNITKPRVMILHSYSPDYAWTRDIDEGIKRISDRWSNYSVTWHYMDTKKHTSKSWLRRAGIVARRAIDKQEPQVLIAVDDLAQKLAARHYVGKQGLDIVFAGVNGSAAPYGYVGADNVTGIFEKKPLRAVKEIVLALEAAKKNPKPSPRILYILDPSPSLQADRPFINGFDWKPLEFAGSVTASDFEEWKQLVKAADDKTDYLMVANYRKLSRSATDSTLADPHEVMSWTEKESPVPTIGVNAFNVEDGAMLSVGASPYEQGEIAAKMAAQILQQGIRAGDISMQTNQQFVIAMREPSMTLRELHLPSIYEAFSRATSNYIE